MATISELELDNSNLSNIETNLNDIISSLTLSINSLVDLSSNIENRYLVDDNNTPIFDRIKNLKNNIETTNDYLSNVILPTIGSTITSNNTTIGDLKAEEERKQQEQNTSSQTTTVYPTGNSKPAKNTTTTKSSNKNNKNNKDKEDEDKWDRW